MGLTAVCSHFLVDKLKLSNLIMNLLFMRHIKIISSIADSIIIGYTGYWCCSYISFDVKKDCCYIYGYFCLMLVYKFPLA